MEDCPIDVEAASPQQDLQNGDIHKPENEMTVIKAGDGTMDDENLSEVVVVTLEDEIPTKTLQEQRTKVNNDNCDKDDSKDTNGDESMTIFAETHQESGINLSDSSPNCSLQNAESENRETEVQETTMNETVIEEDISSDEAETTSEPETKKRRRKISDSDVDYKSEMEISRTRSSLGNPNTGTKGRRKKKSNANRQKKALFKTTFSEIFQAYEKSLKSGNPSKIEEAYSKLSFKGLKTTSHKISALQLVDLKGGRLDAEFRQALMNFIKYPKIAEEGVFDYLLMQLKNTTDAATKKKILKELSSNAMVDFVEVLRLHGIWHLKNKCLTCDETFSDKSSCMQHTFNDHTREQNLARFSALLKESKSKNNNEVHSREIETSSNASSETPSLADVCHRSSNGLTRREFVRIERTSTISRCKSRVPGFIQSSANLRASTVLTNSASPKLATHCKSFSSNVMQSMHSTSHSQESLIKSEVQLEDCAIIQHLNSPMNNSTPGITSSRGNRSFRNSPMLEITSVGRSNSIATLDGEQVLQANLTITVTHEDYPNTKLSEDQFTLFRSSMIREIRVSQQWPKLEDSKYRTSDGVFVVVAADQSSKNWFCDRIMNSRLCDAVLRIQKMYTATVTVPLFDECKDSNQILKELNNYNPMLMTDKWEVIEEHQDDNDCFMVIQMLQSSVDALAVLSYRPYYHFGRVKFEVYGY